jgi:hypothetical protein
MDDQTKYMIVGGLVLVIIGAYMMSSTKQVDTTNTKPNEQIKPVENKLISTPIDCQVSDWTQWSTGCTSTFGDNSGKTYRRRTRQIIRNPANGGKACPTLEDKEECKAQVVGKFIGGGIMRGSYIDLIVKEVLAQPYSTDAKVQQSRANQNKDKRIRVWYQNNQAVGIGYEDTWIVPVDFGNVSILNLAGGFKQTSALELLSEFNTANRYKLLIFNFDLQKALTNKSIDLYYAYDFNGKFSSYIATLKCEIVKGESFHYMHYVDNAVVKINSCN